MMMMRRSLAGVLVQLRDGLWLEVVGHPPEPWNDYGYLNRTMLANVGLELTDSGLLEDFTVFWKALK